MKDKRTIRELLESYRRKEGVGKFVDLPVELTTALYRETLANTSIWEKVSVWKPKGDGAVMTDGGNKEMLGKFEYVLKKDYDKLLESHRDARQKLKYVGELIKKLVQQGKL